MLPSSTRLTIFQRGIAQKCIVFCTYIISITVTALILDWLDKKTFLNIVHEVNALLPFSLNHVSECFSSSLFLLELFAELSVCLLSDRPQNSNHCRGQAWNKVHPYQNSERIFARTRSFPGTQARCSERASYIPKNQKQHSL